VGLSDFYLSTADYKFFVSSQNIAQIGTYTVSLIAGIEGYSTIE
jgi:hypothetical protein